MTAISKCHDISTTNNTNSINDSQEKSMIEKNAMPEVPKDMKNCKNNLKLCTDIRSFLKETTALLSTPQLSDYSHGDENTPRSLDIIVPKSISLACGCVNYESDRNRWQILYRMSPLYFNDNIISSNEKEDVMNQTAQHTILSTSFYVNMRDLIPSCLFLHPTNSFSFDDWKLELNESWFSDIFQILRNRTKTSLPVVYLKSSKKKTDPPPLKIIQFILERVELYSLLTTVEVLFSSKNDSNKLISPLFVTLRNGKMIDLSSVILSDNANISNSIQEKIAKDKTTCISIMKHAKETILATLIISCISFPKIENTSTTLIDRELKRCDDDGYIHPFRRVAINFCISCLYTYNDDTGENKKSKVKIIDQESQNLQDIKNDDHQNKSIEIPKTKTTVLPDLHKSTELVKQDKKKQKRRRNNEVINLTEDYTIPQLKKDKSLNQLFVNDFSINSIVQCNDLTTSSTSKRPKRQLKSVIRFEAKPANIKSDLKSNKVKIGDGFNCPQCDYWLSYDSIQCETCGLKCKYQAGVGVVVMKDRNEIMKKQEFQLKAKGTESTPHFSIIKKKESVITETKKESVMTETKKESVKTETNKQKGKTGPKMEIVKTEKNKEIQSQTQSRSTRSQQNSMIKLVEKESLVQWEPILLNDILLQNNFNQQFLKKKMNSKSFQGIEYSNDIDNMKKFVSKAVKIINARLNILKTRSSTKKYLSQQESLKNDEYVSEIRLYKRTLRDRVAKQEHERGEQEKYKQKVESEQLVEQYVNRNKKRTKEDQELSLLECRPIRYVSKNAWKNARCRKCDIKNCSLCGFVFAHLVLLPHGLRSAQCREEETQLWTSESIDVQSPDFHEISEEELLWSNEKLDTSQNFGTRHETKLILSTTGSKKNNEEEMRLKTMKNDLIFLRRYNEGMMKNVKLEKW